jgi:hypothetical protein
MVTTEARRTADDLPVFRTPLNHRGLRVRRGLVGRLAGAGTAGAIDCRLAVRYVFSYRPDFQL